MNFYIILDYNSRELYIKFFIPEYRNIAQMQYAYKLEGLDKDWTFAGYECFKRRFKKTFKFN